MTKRAYQSKLYGKNDEILILIYGQMKSKKSQKFQCVSKSKTHAISQVKSRCISEVQP